MVLVRLGSRRWCRHRAAGHGRGQGGIAVTAPAGHLTCRPGYWRLTDGDSSKVVW